ncbi:hypothetical protein B0H63DRAFT_490001 [Podospora didyma]|uniref:Uncharacterized protein n=1 Tax=Podospora didyma TaxID=330526 RepID=A0AAE0K0T6_9PEZI|nr:hypothetical protein B0H63DRAFT_490001 [Podospora didyma]
MKVQIPLLAFTLGTTLAARFVENGPDKVEKCGCWPIYQRMLACQKLPAATNANPDAARRCLCIPNPDGWYTSVNGCRGCLAPGSYHDADFFDNMARTVSQLFVSCTNVGGSVQTDGGSVCAGNAYFRACTGLREGKTGVPSWASYELFATGRAPVVKGNGTFLLNIAEFVEGTSSSAAAGVSSSRTETSETETKTRLTGLPSLTRTLTSLPTLTFSSHNGVASSSTSTAATVSTTTMSGATTSGTGSSPSSSAMALAGLRVEPALGLVVAMGVGANMVL